MCDAMFIKRDKAALDDQLRDARDRRIADVRHRQMTPLPTADL